VEIVAALYIEDIELRQVAGPSTRIDLTGVHFSMAAAEPVPTVVAPHLVVIIWCPPEERGTGALEVVFRSGGAAEGDEPLARSALPVQVEPGRFTRQLVRAELPFEEYGTVLAHCRIDLGPVTVVPFTLLPPAENGS